MCILQIKSIVLLIIAFGLLDLIKDLKKMLPSYVRVANLGSDFEAHF